MIDTDELHLRNQALSHAIVHARDAAATEIGAKNHADADEVVATAKTFEEFLRG